eukprot:1156215-Pelagomonas_calceolata.AAC.2
MALFVMECLGASVRLDCKPCTTCLLSRAVSLCCLSLLWAAIVEMGCKHTQQAVQRHNLMQPKLAFKTSSSCHKGPVNYWLDQMLSIVVYVAGGLRCLLVISNGLDLTQTLLDHVHRVDDEVIFPMPWGRKFAPRVTTCNPLKGLAYSPILRLIGCWFKEGRKRLHSYTCLCGSLAEPKMCL